MPCQKYLPILVLAQDQEYGIIQPYFSSISLMHCSNLIVKKVGIPAWRWEVLLEFSGERGKEGDWIVRC